MNTVLDRFEIIVDKYPNKLAFSDDTRQVSFEELKQEALLAAGGIAKLNFYKEPVGVIARHSVDTIVLFLAVLYSGNFYIPLDEDAPIERNEMIIRKSEMKLLLGGVHKGKGVLHYSLESLREECQNPEVLCEIRKNILPTDPLFAVYTSGSTGVPKGIVKSHFAMLSFIDAFAGQFNITKDEIIGNQTPFYFDASSKDIYLSLTVGATVHIIDKALFSFPLRVVQFLNDKKITMICWSPSALMIISQLNIFRSAVPVYLRTVFFVGEVFQTKHLNRWKENLPDTEFINLYGSSEIAGVCTWYRVSELIPETSGIPLGYVLPGTEVFLMNECAGDFQLIKRSGEIGELCIRGPGLGIGYLNEPQRTAEVFIQNPFQKSFREIIYRSGDLAKYDEQGRLCYISRKDFQIKHMGHRVELPEIELKCNQISGVHRAACVYDESRRRIILFVETEKGIDLTSVEVIEKLKESLPAYMVPGKVRILTEIPLNANGKIDRVKLRQYIQPK